MEIKSPIVVKTTLNIINNNNNNKNPGCITFFHLYYRTTVTERTWDFPINRSMGHGIE